MLCEHHEWRPSRKRGSPGEQLIQNTAEAVEIRFAIELDVPRGLLGTHVAHRSHDSAGSCQRYALFSHTTNARDAEIRKHRPPAYSEDVLRFDVAVNYSKSVRICERVGYVCSQRGGLLHRHPPFASETPTQGFAGDQRHHVKKPAISLAGIEQRHNSRMNELRHQSDLARSEEHTSELQSRLHLVCRLLLEKKKKSRFDYWY